ncbi:hypothetical protein [Dyella telluris]|uniref:Lipoprotein n=1 Tax=Dyella telluris TaxID=2763498 RepID=A0A7G8Q0U8_9GAMM|nr:hypothetical protein [Dyella telluris]QNK00406.1 hypothetical protein H8F01_15000 [Dyella telluris]
MKRAGSVAVAVVLLAGCASTGDITHNKPTFQASTTKLDSVYAACVHTRWVAISPTARILETPTSLQVVVSNATMHVEELLVIHSKAVGADVVLYEHLQVLALRGYRDAAKACL